MKTRRILQPAKAAKTTGILTNAKMIIRKAKKEDLNDLAGLHIHLIRQIQKCKPWKYCVAKTTVAYFKKKILKLFKNKDASIDVAEEDGKIIGYSIGIVKNYPSFINFKKYGELYEVSINPKFRGGGIGPKLAKRTLEFFKSKNVEIAEALVDNKNIIALKTWKKLGFKEDLFVLLKKLKSKK